MAEQGRHARHTYAEVEAAAKPVRPLDFPPPHVRRGVRVNVDVLVDPRSPNNPAAWRQFRGVIHRVSEDPDDQAEFAYWPQRQLQDAIFGSVWACLVLRRSRHRSPLSQAAGPDSMAGAPRGPQEAERPRAAAWEITRKHVAIKMVSWDMVRRLRGRHIEDPLKEVAAMQLLGQENPHVLGSIEVLQDTFYMYSVMAYCRDGDLFGIVVAYSEAREGTEEDPRMPEAMVRYWFRQICEGLYYLQSRGVCHRDLSLENILVNGNTCMIIDMGMCLRTPYVDPMNDDAVADVLNGTIRRLILRQGVCGKHNYMSPEIFKNEEPFDGFAVDLWSAGVILYIMLTGFPPYDQASDVDQRFELIVTGRLVEQLNAWEVPVSDGAGHLLQWMLQLDPRQRPTLAQVMSHPWYTNPEILPPHAATPDKWRQR